MAFVPKLPETNVQLAPLPDSALSVRQMPPPAAADPDAASCYCKQFGSIAKCRDATRGRVARPVNVSTSGKAPSLGPSSVH